MALHQTRIKRLLAYSSIAHAGYMIMTASVLAIAEPGEPMRAVTGAVLFYLFVYLFMNLGAFTVAALIGQADRRGRYPRLRGPDPSAARCWR